MKITEEIICAFLGEREQVGTSKLMLQKYRGLLRNFYVSLPEDKEITPESLAAWRKGLQNQGYAANSQTNYVKAINLYLKYIGKPERCFTKGRSKDIRGKTFGYLTAIKPTNKRWRKDVVWLCQCKCGKTTENPATRLIAGNTLSCGCLGTERLKRHNRYIGGTALRQSLEEKILNPNSVSGYVGVTQKRGKWVANINYKGKRVCLGTYSKLEDAVKARARGKEAVMEDARVLETVYEEQHGGDPDLPNRECIPRVEPKEAMQKANAPVPNAVRADNKSGCTGVFFQDNRWQARITYKKISYRLGAYEEKKAAIEARKKAESLLRSNPDKFIEEYRDRVSYINK